MQKITPFLWFNNNGEEAINFYTAIFKNSKTVNIHRNGKGSPAPEGSLMMGTFEIEGQQFYVLNGGPMFTFSQAISFFVNCENQQEVDELWDKLSEGGEQQQCGWLKDKFGLSWQIIPTILGKLMSDKDTSKSQRVMQAMLQMKKIEIDKLQHAYDGQ